MHASKIFKHKYNFLFVSDSANISRYLQQEGMQPMMDRLSKAFLKIN